jgi:hypothetical protein
MNPVWDLARRRAFSRLAFWLLALGYDARDRSTTNRVYLVYFCLFWLGWITAMFALLGTQLAQALRSMPGIDPLQLVILLSTYALSGWAVIQLWQAARRSPFVFSEQDSFLLCQTPVSRRTVGLAWFLQSWFATAPFFAAGAVILSFTLVEFGPRQVLPPLMLVQYLGAALRALSLVVPLQMALQAAVWGIGALRLGPRGRGGARENLWLRLAAPLLGLVLLASLLVPGAGSVVLVPIRLPLQAAFTAGSSLAPGWWIGFGLCLLYLGASLIWLANRSTTINLGQAARETRIRYAVQLARSLQRNDLAAALIQQEHLRAVHRPSRLPARAGRWVLVWKDAVQSLRSLRLSLILSWLVAFVLCLGMFRASSWALQMVLAGLWTISLGSLTARRLRSDLARWWLLRSLPLRGSDLLTAELALSCGLGTLLGWLALAFSGRPLGPCLIAAALLPFLVISAALGSAHDILRHSKARFLMAPGIAEENVPQQNAGGVLQGLASVLLPAAILFWLWASPDRILAGPVALLLAAFIVILNLQSVLVAYRWIE